MAFSLVFFNRIRDYSLRRQQFMDVHDVPLLVWATRGFGHLHMGKSQHPKCTLEEIEEWNTK